MISSAKKILLVVSGSVSAFKALLIVSELSKAGHLVRCVLTRGGSQFLTPLAIESLSHEPVFQDEFKAGELYSHLELPKWADLILYCPASASLISRLAQGAGSDLASLIFLADNLKTPTFLAPAMNSNMFEHPLVKKNLQVLQDLGVHIIGPEEGILACGDIGVGRMSEPVDILKYMEEYL